MKQGLEETSNVTALVVASKAEIDEFLKMRRLAMHENHKPKLIGYVLRKE